MLLGKVLAHGHLMNNMEMIIKGCGQKGIGSENPLWLIIEGNVQNKVEHRMNRYRNVINDPEIDETREEFRTGKT